MNKVIVIFVISLITAFTFYQFASKPEVRATFDMGSGSIKMMVAEVDTKGHPIKILASDQEDVLFGQDFKQNGNGKLSKEVLLKGRNVFEKFINVAKKHGAQKMAGIATAVFRESENGAAYIKGLQHDFDINIQLVTQEDEGEIGFLTAVASTHLPAEKITVWDAGASSFQISTQNQVYEGPWGSSKGLAAILTFQNKDPSASKTANPATIQDLELLKQAIQKALPEMEPALRNRINGQQVIAIGGVNTIFNMAYLGIGNTIFSKSQVWDVIVNLAGKTDQELSAFPQKEILLPKLVLLYTVMERFNIKEIEYHPTNGSTLGIFLYSPLWS